MGPKILFISSISYETLCRDYFTKLLLFVHGVLEFRTILNKLAQLAQEHKSDIKFTTQKNSNKYRCVDSVPVGTSCPIFKTLQSQQDFQGLGERDRILVACIIYHWNWNDLTCLDFG